MTVKLHGFHQFTFLSEAAPGSTVAWDKISTTAGKCLRTQQFCDFDQSFEGQELCDWLDFKDSGGFKWKALREDSEMYQDVSSRSKYGLVLSPGSPEDYTNGKAKGDISFTLPLFTGNFGPHCFSFWYYYAGDRDTVFEVSGWL